MASADAESAVRKMCCASTAGMLRVKAPATTGESTGCQRHRREVDAVAVLRRDRQRVSNFHPAGRRTLAR